MPKRKLLIALTVAGLFVAAFGSSTMSASADQRTSEAARAPETSSAVSQKARARPSPVLWP